MAAITFILHLFFLIPFLQINYSHSQSLRSLQTLFTTFNARGTSNYCPSSTSSSVAINLPTLIPNSSLTLVCYNNIITQLHITGDNNNRFDHEYLSTESFFYTISAIFPNLKVLSLVSLALDGPLPASVLAKTVSSLEILNISSNHFHGDIPFELSYLKNLQTLVLDHNNFSGSIPDWLGNLSSLRVLSFKNNSLNGSLPFSLSRLLSLRVLDLSKNQLSGDVPVDFKNLTNLQVLDLESNQLGPSFPVLHNRLLVLVLRENRFSYGIQGYDLRSFFQLRKLDLSSNEFNGPLPDFLFSLPSISYLNFSGNKFTGKLSANVSCNDELVSVDLSLNRFTGELPTCMQTLENNKRGSVLYGWNCLSNVDKKQQHNDSFCHNEALAVMIKPPVSGDDGSSKSSKVKVVVASSVVGGVVIGGVAVFGVVLVAIRSEFFGGGCAAATPQIRVLVEKISPAYTIKMLTDARYISETMKLGAVGILAYRTYVLGELIEATNNFHRSTCMGDGSHGQLYKGQLNDGSIVAIRNLKLRKRCSIQSYTRQIELISKLRHPNLVNPIGHCFERHTDDSAIIHGVFLVFEFVPNGTLRASLMAGQKFSWAQRLSAAIGISKGIQFLNTRITAKLFPDNLKITDVLLDQNFQVKISGYNLPLLPETKVSAGHSATRSSENLGRSKRFETEEDDHDHVYDMGVIMLELILGRAIDCISDITIAKDMLHVSLVADEVARRSILDPLVRKECCDESLKTLMELCLRCMSKDRPSIDDVLWNLEFIAQAHTSSMEDSMNNIQTSTNEKMNNIQTSTNETIVSIT
ncbi:probable inactive leucine-rich repeat receptor-like protein kinase At3g03770 [Lactuca sativa]|uniref:probable inactive leucine-rich repeat receptor-like protein kinase At3g03770 n=1 Tax=Lactuca sativa TaxID=4236 RepID=UPI000CB3EC2B|nr:probable inactive leucine-rich repeat receptor-like protein kinase At3g03770 [Lactuca sativa]